jgi:hypothetical protein
MANLSIKKHLMRLDSLEQDRMSWVSNWKNIAEYIIPRRGSFNNIPNNAGSSVGSKIWDSTATVAVERLASGIHSGLTSPTRPWFKLMLLPIERMDSQNAREWFESAEQVLYNAFAHSNFYDALHEAYVELTCFGSTCVLLEEGIDGRLNFRVVPAGQYYFAPGQDGRIDTMYRKFWLQVHQIVQQFGGSIPKRISDKIDKDPYAWEQVVHCILPNTKYNPHDKRSVEKQFESSYFLYEGNNGTFLRRSGYEELPFFAPRWSVNGDEVYGRGPGTSVLPDVKMLQEMTKTFLKAVHKAVDPPLSVPAGTKGRINLMPGGITFYNGTSPDSIKPLMEVKFDMAAVQSAIQTLRQQIKLTLYNDLFAMGGLEGRDRVTATEITGKREEQMLMLGPVIERLGHELLDPCLARAVGILSRNGSLPPVPDEIAGSDYSIQYISTLAQAQKAVGTGGIRQVTEFVGAAMQLQQDVVDKVDFDHAITEFARMVGVPSGSKKLKPSKNKQKCNNMVLYWKALKNWAKYLLINLTC